MTGYTLTYKAPPSGQPAIQFRLGQHVFKIADGETVRTAGNATDFAILPPGVTAEPTAKPEPDEKARRSTMARPAKPKTDTKDKAPKAEEK